MAFEDALAGLPSLEQPKVRLPWQGPSRASVRWIFVGLHDKTGLTGLLNRSDRPTKPVWPDLAEALQGASLRATYSSVIMCWPRIGVNMCMPGSNKHCTECERNWLGMKTKMVVPDFLWSFSRFYQILSLNKNKKIIEKNKNGKKNMKVKVEMIWASSDHFLEISYFCSILPYFIDRNIVFMYITSPPCYLYF